MGRSVRRVPANWQHLQDVKGNFIPLLDGAAYLSDIKDWDEGAEKWERGLRSDNHGGWQARSADETGTYTDWTGSRPNAENYTALCDDSERTHFMMYEDVTLGRPISPAFATAEELARWLTENDVPFWGDMRTSYEHWLDVITESSSGFLTVEKRIGAMRI